MKATIAGGGVIPHIHKALLGKQGGQPGAKPEEWSIELNSKLFIHNKILTQLILKN